MQLRKEADMMRQAMVWGIRAWGLLRTSMGHPGMGSAAYERSNCVWPAGVFADINFRAFFRMLIRILWRSHLPSLSPTFLAFTRLISVPTPS